jgi:hypothetical protein
MLCAFFTYRFKGRKGIQVLQAFVSSSLSEMESIQVFITSLKSIVLFFKRVMLPSKVAVIISLKRGQAKGHPVNVKSIPPKIL